MKKKESSFKFIQDGPTVSHCRDVIQNSNYSAIFNARALLSGFSLLSSLVVDHLETL